MRWAFGEGKEGLGSEVCERLGHGGLAVVHKSHEPDFDSVHRRNRDNQVSVGSECGRAGTQGASRIQDLHLVQAIVAQVGHDAVSDDTDLGACPAGADGRRAQCRRVVGFQLQ